MYNNALMNREICTPTEIVQIVKLPIKPIP